ncbi:hypothetical protein ACIRQP_19415 [Streptomyces sp. NPDC102274]
MPPGTLDPGKPAAVKASAQAGTHPYSRTTDPFTKGTRTVR